MKKILSALALAVAAFAATAGPLTLSGFEHGSAPTGTMTVNPPGAFNTNSVTAGVGALNATFGTDIWLLYCIELFAPAGNFGSPVNGYTQNDFPALLPFGAAFTALQTTQLEKLFVQNFNTAFTPTSAFGGTDNATASAAMQLAVWEIVYDSTSSLFGDLTAGNMLIDIGQNTNAGEFYSTSVSGARTLAESMLASLGSVNTAGYTVGFTSFNNGSNKNAGKQDFLGVSIIESRSCNEGDCGGTVSEPGSMALAGLGLFGLLAASKRRKTA